MIFNYNAFQVAYMSFKNNKFNILAVVFAIILAQPAGALMVHFLNDSNTQKDYSSLDADSQELEKLIFDISDNMNASLPKKIDDSTTLLQVKPAPMSLILDYRIEAEPSILEQHSNIRQEIRNLAISVACDKNNDAVYFLLERGISLEFAYKDINNSPFAQFYIEKTDCQ